MAQCVVNGECCHIAKRPGYATPLEAMEKGPKEKLIYVTRVYNSELASCITPIHRPGTSHGRIMQILTYTDTPRHGQSTFR